MQVSERVKKIKPSPTLALAAKASELSAQGHDVISLSVGEPDWNTLNVSVEAGIKAIREGFTKYTPSNGIPELRKCISARLKKELYVEYAVDEITVTAGGKFVLHSALQALLNPGDEVIIPSPYWVSYPTMVEMSEGKPVIVDCPEKTHFKMTAEMLAQAVTPKTKAVLYSSPSNPTGQIYTHEELKSWVSVLKDHPHVMIMSDDIYNQLTFEGKGVAPHILEVEPSFRNRTVILTGASKSFSMTGWRVGWAAAPKELIQSMNKYQSQTVSCAAGFAQKAAAAALSMGDEELRKSVQQLKERLDFSLNLLKEIKGMSALRPGGAFYLWVNIHNLIGRRWQDREIKNSSDFAAFLLEDKKVAVVPGVEFGQEGYFRMSFTHTKERLTEAFKRMRDFTSEIK